MDDNCVRKISEMVASGGTPLVATSSNSIIVSQLMAGRTRELGGLRTSGKFDQRRAIMQLIHRICTSLIERPIQQMTGLFEMEATLIPKGDCHMYKVEYNNFIDNVIP